MRVTAVRFCRTWAVDEVSSTGRRALWLRTRLSARTSGSRWVIPHATRLKELPPINLRVSEHRCQWLRCPDCGRRTRATLPVKAARSCFGPRLEAAAAAISVRNRISRCDAVELCEELFGARISWGTVDAIIARTAQALGEPHEDLLRMLRCSGALNHG